MIIFIQLTLAKVHYSLNQVKVTLVYPVVCLFNCIMNLSNLCFSNVLIIILLAASPRRRGLTVASRLWLCIFNSRFATVTSQPSLPDRDSTYLTKLANSRFATVALHI